MLKTGDGHGGLYPQPPQTDLPAAEDLHRALCVVGHEAAGKIHHLHTAIRDRLPVKDLNLTFGRYLFHCLIGCETWNGIEKAAGAEAEARKAAGEAGAGEVIELALRWPAQAPYLHRLNWEMMCRPATLLDSHPNSYGFLADGFPRRVAITRHVTGVEHASREVGCPPKILFVVGSRPDDPRILPGLELVGLLDRLEGKRRIHYDVLLKARPSTIKEKMGRFKPDIVHFICHGEFDQQGSYLVMYNDEAEADKRRDASALLEDLKSHGSLPAIVVLSACHSAVSQGAHQIGPMAAGLVAGGVPVVVGMAGQVSDLACRLFTRRFAEALVLGQPLVSATAEGRAAAVYGGKRVLESTDWALPAIFMSPLVEANYKPWPLADGTTDPGIVIESRAGRYADDAGPVFCDRYPFFDAHYELMDPNRGASVLAIFVEKMHPSDLGKTRLLKELAARIVREGYVPCLVSDNLKDSSATYEPGVHSMTQLGLLIVRAIAHACRAFKVQPPVDSMLFKQIVSKMPAGQKATALAIPEDFAGDPDSAYELLLAECEKFEAGLTAGAVKAALRSDLRGLADRLCQKYPAMDRGEGKPVVAVLLDDVHKYDVGVIQGLTETLLTDADGLGTEQRPVPVILAFFSGSEGGPMLYTWLGKGRKWLIKQELKPFSKVESSEIEKRLAGEDIQAYARVLLNPFGPDRFPGVSDRPLAINPDAEDATKERWVGYFQDFLAGHPRIAFGDMLWVYAKKAKDERFLIEGHHERQLAELEEKMRKGEPVE